MRNALLIVALLFISLSLQAQTAIKASPESGVYFLKGRLKNQTVDVIYNESGNRNHISLDLAKTLYKKGIITKSDLVSFPKEDTISAGTIIKMPMQLDSVDLHSVQLTVVDKMAADVYVSNIAFGNVGTPVVDYNAKRIVVAQKPLPVFKRPSQLNMMNGRTYDIQLVNYDLALIQFKLPGKKKLYTANRDKVFSIVDSTRKTYMVYTEDSLIGNTLRATELKNYLTGFNDGRRYRWGGNFAIGFASGIGGSFLGPLYGLSGPLAVSFVSSLMPAKPTRHVTAHPELYDDEYYRMGVRKKIKQRRFISTFLGGTAGMATGLMIFQFIVRPLTGISSLL